MDMKLWIALGLGALAGVAFFGASVVSWPLLQSFLVGVSSSLVVAAMGVIALNFYLENSTRRSAVKALFFLSQEAIAKFHNHWLEVLWARFGRTETGQMFDEFHKASLSPSALKKESRDYIYSLYRDNPEIRQNIVGLENSLAELSRMMGWSLDPKVLRACLAARTAIAELSIVTLDDSDEVVDAVVKGLMVVDALSQVARSSLAKIAGIDD